VQQKAEIGTWQNRSVSWLPALHAEADPDRNTSDPEFDGEDQGDTEKNVSYTLRWQSSLHPTARMSRYLSIC